MKTAKRILTVALALMLICALAAPSFAVTPNSMYANGASSYYIQGSSSSYEVTQPITVSLYINSGIYQKTSSLTYTPLDNLYTVTLTPSGSQAFTVADVLAAVHNTYTNICFDTSTPDPFNYHQNYLYGVRDTATLDPSDPTFWYDARPLYYTTETYYCGWMFRINGNIPAYTSVENGITRIKGYAISNSYVSNGDVIHLYYCNIFNRNYATKPRAFIYDTNDTNCTCSYDDVNEVYSVTVRALQCECYKDYNDNDWNLENWGPVASKSFDVLVDGVSQSTQTNANGYCTITVDALGTHTIQQVTTTKAFKVNANTNFPKWKVPKELGLYCTISIPNAT